MSSNLFASRCFCWAILLFTCSKLIFIVDSIVMVLIWSIYTKRFNYWVTDDVMLIEKACIIQTQLVLSISCGWLLSILSNSCSNVSDIIIFRQTELRLLLIYIPSNIIWLLRSNIISKLAAVVDIACWRHVILLLLLSLMWCFQIFVNLILLIEFKFAIYFSDVSHVLFQARILIQILVWSICNPNCRISSSWSLKILLHTLSLMVWCFCKWHVLLFILIQFEINLVVVVCIKITCLNRWLINKIINNYIWHTIWSLNWHMLFYHWVHILNIKVVIWLKELLSINFSITTVRSTVKFT